MKKLFSKKAPDYGLIDLDENAKASVRLCQSCYSRFQIYRFNNKQARKKSPGKKFYSPICPTTDTLSNEPESSGVIHERQQLFCRNATRSYAGAQNRTIRGRLSPWACKVICFTWLLLAYDSFLAFQSR